jgi:hypothetical protein
MVMLEPTVEIQAISAKVGAAASPSQRAKPTACPSNEVAFSFAANIVISGPAVEFAVSTVSIKRRYLGQPER